MSEIEVYYDKIIDQGKKHLGYEANSNTHLCFAAAALSRCLRFLNQFPT